jgi:nitrogen fixation protein NifQ
MVAAIQPTVPLPPPLRADLATLASRPGPLARDDEVADVRQLLLAYADAGAGPAELAHHVAHTVAVACLGDNHLWQDLGFANRQQLGALLRHWFPALVAKNSGDMKWKKFFYRQLCEAEDVLICKSPSCAVCTDYVHCFEAPEPGAGLPAAASGAPTPPAAAPLHFAAALAGRSAGTASTSPRA